MRRRTWGWIGLAALFSLNIALLETALRKPSNGLQNEESTAGNSAQKEHIAFWERTTNDPIAVFTLVLTVATVTLAWSTYFLWKATDRLVLESKNSAERQLRAYVTLKTIHTSHTTDDVRQGVTSTSFVPVLKNSGQSPAMKVTHYTTLAFSFDIEGRDIIYSVEAPSHQTIVGPGLSEWAPSTREVTLGEMRELSANKITVVIYGAVNYEDIFQKTHRTEFSAFVALGGWVGSRELRWTKSAKHNNADEHAIFKPYAKPGDPPQKALGL